MQHHEFTPPKALRHSIKCFWYNSRDYGEQPSYFDVVPDGYTEIIFHFGSGCSLLTQAGLQQLPSPFLMGLLKNPAIFCSKNRLQIIGIRCFPWAVFDLLGLPSNKSGIYLLNHPIAQLQFKLGGLIDAGLIEQAIAEVKRCFLNVPTPKAIDMTLSKAVVALSEAKGTIPVSKVAEAAHATVRTLERKFKQASGYSVKDVAGLMRFEQARNHLWHNPDFNLAGLAHELGYTDQSHLSKEFKRYCGVGSAAFARKTTKEQRDLSADFRVFKILK